MPPTHGFMISSTGMRNVWLSMEHQAILWCNQLVVQVSRSPLVEPRFKPNGRFSECVYSLQVSHTLLSLMDSRTGQPFPETQKRLTVFSKMLRSGIPRTFNWMKQPYSSHQSTHTPIKDIKNALGNYQSSLYGCIR